MKCEDCLVLIEDFIDGELDERAAKRVLSHTAVCESCANFFEEMRQEQDLYAHYSRDVEVTPALWAGVRERISRERAARAGGLLARLGELFGGLIATPRLSPAVAAALVVVAVGVTVAVMSLINSRDNGAGGQVATNNGNGAITAPPVVENKPANAVKQPSATDEGAARDERVTAQNKRQTDSVPAAEKAVNRQLAQKRTQSPAQASPDQLVREAEQKYVAAINILSRDVDRRRSKMDPAVVARFTVALNDINNTIAETRRAARENPDDPIALQYMLTAYRKKVEVLREMARD